MPRQDVPYGGAICRLKERIAELFDLVEEKLHSINGVQGDGQGDVKIISGDPAVVITNDAAQNEIEIALDSSELPSAAVQSVNGETGAVVLDGNDIDAGFSTPGTTVTQALESNAQQLQVIGGLVQQEILDRQNGDAALQTNINAVQAGIPAAAAAAVAADPTVAQLAADVPNKVDKITSGSTKRAYTHTGSVQDDTPVVNGTDANSIGLRDANGRMYAADPANGATDRSLTTANWISQSGNNSPNNLVHKNGNEIIYGNKDMVTSSSINELYHVTLLSTAPGVGWYKMFSIKAQGNCIIWVEGRTNSNQIAKSQYFIFSSTIDAIRSHSPSIHILTASVAAQCDINNYAACQRIEDGIIWIDYFINNKVGSYSGLSIKVSMEGRNGAISDLTDNITYYANTAEDPTGYADVQYGNNAGEYKL